MIERMVNVERVEDLIAVFGSFDENIRRIEDALSVSIVNRGNELKIVGDPEAVDKAARTLEGLLTIAARGEVIDEQRVRYLLTLVQEGNDDQVSRIAKDVVCISAKGKPIKAKTVGQQSLQGAGCFVYSLRIAHDLQLIASVDNIHAQRILNAPDILVEGAEDCDQILDPFNVHHSLDQMYHAPYSLRDGIPPAAPGIRRPPSAQHRFL